MKLRHFTQWQHQIFVCFWDKHKYVFFPKMSDIKHLRWKACFFEHPWNTIANENFGFMPNKTTPQNEHLNPFEYDFCEFARNVEFKNIKNELPISSEVNWKYLDLQISFMFLPTRQTGQLYLKSDSQPRKNLVLLFYLPQWKVLKMMKNAFYFMLKALFVLKIIKFIFSLFWSCKKMVW